MEQKIKFPRSQKVYLPGKLYPNIRIGMSALVRYFLSKGKNVGGYDRTPSELTEKLF